MYRTKKTGYAVSTLRLKVLAMRKEVVAMGEDGRLDPDRAEDIRYHLSKCMSAIDEYHYDEDAGPQT